MNFSPYQSRGQLAAPNQNYTDPLRVSYNNRGEQALARANTEMVGVFVKGLQDMKDQYDSGKVMEANNEYNRLMTEGSAELMQRKQENALNVVDDYDKLHVKTMEKVRKKYGQFINYGKAGQAFNIYTERDNNTRRANMLKYQMAETDAYHETQFNNQLAECQNTAAQGGYSDLSIEAGMNRADGFIEERYAPYGKEMIEQQKRIFKGQIVGNALQTAINIGDYARMGELSSKYNDYLDPKTRVSVLSLLGKRQREAHDLRQATDMFSRFGKLATWEDMRNVVEAEMRGKNGAESFFAKCNSYCGVEMDNGRVGCVEYVMKVLDGLTKFGTNNAEQRNVGNLFRAAIAQNSGMNVFRYNGQQLRAGDIIFYSSPGDDDSDPDNLEHVTVSDGNGGYYGNSSGARDYEDENGNYVRGNGCGVHADDQEIGGYDISFIARPDDIQAQELSALQIEEETNRRWELYEKQVRRQEAMENRVIKQGHQEMQKLMNAGVTDVSQYQAIANQYSYVDGVVNETIQTELEKTVASLERRNERATTQAARNQPSAKVSEMHKAYVRDRVARGMFTENDITNYCTDNGITSETEIKKLMKILTDWEENKGEWEIPYDRIMRDCEIDERHFPDKKSYEKNIKEMARQQYELMLAENKGRLQDGWEADLSKRVADSMTNYYVGGTYRDKGVYFNTEETTRVPLRDIVAAGYRPVVQRTGDDGYILYKTNGEAVYMTGNELRALQGYSDYIE